MTNNKGAYHGKPELKVKYVSRMKAHIAADQLIHGFYFENGKGCAIGCVVETSNNPHQQMASELGWPLSVVYLYEKIFESLEGQHPQDKQFPLKVLRAVKEGSDLSLVAPKLMHWLLTDERQGLLQHVGVWREHDKKDKYTTKVVEAIKQTAEVIKRWIETGTIDKSAAWSAESAAWSASSAAWSAESAAWSAESAAWSAAWSARSAAESAAGSAAWSAESAARSADDAEQKAWIAIADKFIGFVSSAPVMEVFS